MESSSKSQENTYPFHKNGSPPLPVSRSETNNHHPTTFIQADTSSFKQVVQRLTGSSDSTKRSDPFRNPIPPIRTGPRKQKSSKLYERVNSLKNFKLSPLKPGQLDTNSGSTRKLDTEEILSPSLLNFPGLVLSPVTPLIHDPFNRSPNSDVEAEERAIKENGFYLHPDTPRDSEPRLLPLFPVTSPKVSGSLLRMRCRSDRRSTNLVLFVTAGTFRSQPKIPVEIALDLKSLADLKMADEIHGEIATTRYLTPFCSATIVGISPCSSSAISSSLSSANSVLRRQTNF